MLVRLDSNAGFDERITYSYSLDGGVSWNTGNVVSDASTASTAVLTIPGGMLTLASNAAAGTPPLLAGTQYVVHPRSADIELDISYNERIRINDVGKDIFGGVYRDPASNGAVPVFSSKTMILTSNAGSGDYTENLFENMGNLVSFLETNNQTGVQQALEGLNLAQEHILGANASVGGRENRLEVADTVLEGLELNQGERISTIEDADVGELMSKLAQQEIVYQAVLRSSSMIMKMNLMNYI